MKIGATRREDPQIRLLELSRHVTTPFLLCGWIPSPTPFLLEKQTHAHFKQQRIRGERGTATEYFAVSREEAGAYAAGRLDQ